MVVTESFDQMHYTKLFVAGIPSGIDQLDVLEYFNQFGSFYLCGNSNTSNSDKVSKGYCNLLSYNSRETKKVVDQAFFSFMGRTLTVTKHRSGLSLIVHNKKINKCRVIIKGVPNYYSEDQLREELLHSCGQLQSLFQFKPVNPIDHYGKIRKTVSKFTVYSAVFEEKITAQDLIQAGYLTLFDGSIAKIEPFLKCKKKLEPHNLETGYHQTNHTNETKQLFKRESFETGMKSQALRLQEKIQKPVSTKSHSIKPTSRSYNEQHHTVGQLSWDSYQQFTHNGANYRINSPVHCRTSSRKRITLSSSAAANQYRHF